MNTTNFLSCATKLECVLADSESSIEVCTSQKKLFWSAGSAVSTGEKSHELLLFPGFFFFPNTFPVQGGPPRHALCLELITYKISNKVILHLIDRLGQLLLLSLFFIRFSAMLFLIQCGLLWNAAARAHIFLSFEMRDGLSAFFSSFFKRCISEHTVSVSICSPYNEMTMNL